MEPVDRINANPVPRITKATGTKLLLLSTGLLTQARAPALTPARQVDNIVRRRTKRRILDTIIFPIHEAHHQRQKQHDE